MTNFYLERPSWVDYNWLTAQVWDLNHQLYCSASFLKHIWTYLTVWWSLCHGVWYLVFLYDCVKCSLENVSVNSLCSDGLPLWREFSFVFLTVQTHSGKDQLVLFGATECSAFLCVIAISRPSWHRQPSNGEQGAGEELGRMRGSSGFASAQVNPLIGSKGRRVARLCWPPGGAV